MKNRIFFLLSIAILVTSCQVTETIHIKEDGSGDIEVKYLRDEQSYMQLAGENYSKEEKFVDTTYVFKDYITKYSEIFFKFTKDEQKLFERYENVNVHIKQSSYEKEYFSIMSQNFNTIEEVPDIYKTGEYAGDLKNNYALTAEEHYYNVSFTFDRNLFKRIVKVTDSVELKKQKDKILEFKNRLKFKINEPYILKYHFPRKIKSVSNANAKISEDKKSLELQFLLSDCLQNPEITNLEVVLE